MGKAETKFSNTAKKMDDALLGLLAEKPFDEISVTDVCKCANVNRSTFYAHYSNTFDLLDEVKATLMEGFYDRFSHLSLEEGFLSRDYLDVYLEFVEENRLVFQVVLANQALFDSTGVFDVIVGRFGEYDLTGKRMSPDVLEYRLLYMTTGITSIVARWLRGGCRESRSRMIDIILECAGESK